MNQFSSQSILFYKNNDNNVEKLLNKLNDIKFFDYN